MRAVVAVCSSDGSNPSRGVKPLREHLRVAHAVEPVRARLVALGVPRVDVPVGEPPLDRVRLDRPRDDLLLLGLQVLDLDELVPVDRLRQLVDETLFLADVRRGCLRRARTRRTSPRASRARGRAASARRRRSSARRTRAPGGSPAPRAASAAAAGGTCRRRAPCRRAPRRRAARRRRRSSRRRS